MIGRAARSVDEARALGHVAGYCLLNDVSEREFQMEHGGGTTKGKSADTFAPIGPWLVTADEIADPQALALWTTVNGERRQHGSTRDMVFSVANLVAYLSRFMTLLPGDLVSTGTPAGVGHGARPPRYLAPGDTVEQGIDGLGHAAAPGDPAPGVILVEHATVVTVDDRRRVFVDGSVLVDGSRILAGGPRARGAPAARARPGDRRAPPGGDARIRGHPRPPLRAPEPRPARSTTSRWTATCPTG